MSGRQRLGWLLLALLAALAAALLGRAAPQLQRPALALLVPDTALSDPLVEIWQQAALEEGIPLEVVGASSLMQDKPRYAGLILPDGAHREAGTMFLGVLSELVASGTPAFVVFDAATRLPSGAYAVGRSRLSSLVGVGYALYDSLRDATQETGFIAASPASAESLQLPPGKFAAESGSEPRPGFNLVLQTYAYGRLRYSSFRTSGDYDGRTLLVSASGSLVAGLRPYGAGQVLFVNLPLGELKGATDGWLLHRFLRYFAREVVGMPTLAATPEGIGGLVMNLHVDSNAAFTPLHDLEADGVFAQGPYSIHVTAGPGLEYEGDGRGFDIDRGEARHWVARLAGLGHEIGSHGGWTHNLWADHATEENGDTFAPFLKRNCEALAAVIGRPVTEYSAPGANHPRWVTRWLAENGIVGYYTTANSGSAPTRSFRAGVREDLRTWSFPVMSRGRDASFEEAMRAGLSPEEVSDWLRDVTRYVVRTREARLVYYHPPGIRFYPRALREWLDEAAGHAADKRFRWYTITGLSAFLNRRERLQWQLEAGDGDKLRLVAQGDLAQMAWLLPRGRWRSPVVREGEALVDGDSDDWRIVARGGDRLVADIAPLR